MENERETKIIKTCIIGIITNIFLSVFKAVIGFMAHSVAIMMDALNNLTDAVSGIITLVGTYLAGRDPDKKHPFGHGRTEYLATLAISGLILYAGISASISSIKSIINPKEPEYETIMLIIIFVAVIVKIVLSFFYKKRGKETESGSLTASGSDAGFDAVISAATLVCAFIYIFFEISIEAYLGVIIAIFIMKSGIGILAETVSKILGEGASVELVKEIKNTIAAHDKVRGAYDLVINNYGHDRLYGSLHIEVPENFTANELDCLTREINDEIYEKFGVTIVAVGVYAYNESDFEVAKMRAKATEIALSHEFVKQVHGFYVDKKYKKIRFDMVISLDAKNRADLYFHVISDLKKEFPGYDISGSMDSDFNEI